MEENFDRRIRKDRRKRPTSGLSRFTFLGRRKSIRRKTDQKQGGYVDQYSSLLLFLLISIIGLNVLDALFTLMILDLKGWEANPVVSSVITLYGTKFWIWKFFIVSVSLVLLCLHSRFRLVKELIVVAGCLYFFVVVYQIFLFLHL
jgi:Domain of unknown function (DUF5658)